MLEMLLSDGDGPRAMRTGVSGPGPSPRPGPRDPADPPLATALFSLGRSFKFPVYSQAVDGRWGASLLSEFRVPYSLHSHLGGGTAACDCLEEGERGSGRPATWTRPRGG